MVRLCLKSPVCPKSRVLAQKVQNKQPLEMAYESAEQLAADFWVALIKSLTLTRLILSFAKGLL